LCERFISQKTFSPCNFSNKFHKTDTKGAV